MVDSWVDLVEKKAQIIHGQIASARALMLKRDSLVEGFERPYLDLLRQLYEEEFPLAQLIDGSDLVARFEGRSISEGSAPARVVASAVSGLRNQIRVIARAIAGLNTDVPWPDSLDPLLTGLSKGSLVIGISIPSSRIEVDDAARQSDLPAMPDPVLDSVRDSVRRVAVVAQYVRDDYVDEEIETEIPDPAIRDTVLVAASKLAPTRQSRVDELVLYEPGSTEKEAIPLTAESRRVLRKAVARPVKVSDTATFVRAIDLDAKRFEIRHVKEVNGGSVRCVYTNAEVANERYILGREVRVHGRYEPVDGKPRLIEVIRLDVQTQKDLTEVDEQQGTLLTVSPGADVDDY